MESELTQLRRIAEAASDFLMGERYPEFAGENGGLERLRRDLVDAVNVYEGTEEVKR